MPFVEMKDSGNKGPPLCFIISASEGKIERERERERERESVGCASVLCVCVSLRVGRTMGGLLMWHDCDKVYFDCSLP